MNDNLSKLVKYPLTNISTLLAPLQNAIALACWDDAEDLAREISKMCRIKRLEEFQAIHEAVAGSHESNRAKTSAMGISAPNSPPCFNSEAAYAAIPAPAPNSPLVAWSGFDKEGKPALRPEPEITLETRFDERGHAEPWRNEVAKELNYLLVRAEHTTDHRFRDVIFSIASRVAEFDEIQPVVDEPRLIEPKQSRATREQHGIKGI